MSASVFGFVTRKAPGIAILLVAVLVATAFMAAFSTHARAETRSLYLYNTHTHEKTRITFKKNGRYVRSGLRDLNRFLRDWRRNESIKMDPRLFDLVWSVYKRTGTSKPIHVVSGYRSPATNNMLRRRSRGVAKFSQHTLGKAMDFFIPGVASSRIRVIGMKRQVGGVGYYPRSRSKFVHLDTGRVRHWPRMSRRQLVKVFPQGNTLHLPRGNKPLPGYQTALARAKSGKSLAARSTRVASLSGSVQNTYVTDGGDGEILRQKGTGSNFLTSLFGGGLDEEEDNATDVAPAAPAQKRKGPVPPAQVGQRTQVASLTPAAPAVNANPTPPELKTETPKVATGPAPKPRPKPATLVASADTGASEEKPAETTTAEAGSYTARPRIKPAVPTLVAAAEPAALEPDQTTTAALPANKPDEEDTTAGSTAAVMAYAPALPARKPSSVLDATRDFASAGSQLAYAPAPQPRARPAHITTTAGDSGTTIAPRSDPPSDPFARFTDGRQAAGSRLFTASQKAQAMAFAELYHPDQHSLRGLIKVPRRTVANDFSNSSDFGLKTDLFSGTAIAALRIQRTY